MRFYNSKSVNTVIYSITIVPTVVYITVFVLKLIQVIWKHNLFCSGSSILELFSFNCSYTDLMYRKYFLAWNPGASFFIYGCFKKLWKVELADKIICKAISVETQT